MTARKITRRAPATKVADTPDYRELKWQLYDTQIKHKLLAKIGVDPNQALAATNGKS